MQNRKILIIEDEVDINHLLVHILKTAGYETVSAYSGSEAMLRLSVEEYDLILLDLMLPGMPGEELIEYIRRDSFVPVIVISAKTSLEDKVSLFHKGVDDYMTKPFEKEEVLVRVEARLRGYHPEEHKKTLSDEYQIRELCLRKNERVVSLAGIPVNLTISEFDILALLMSQPDKVYSKGEIYEHVWHGTYLGEDNTISVHISNIRAKLLKIKEEEYIKTVWGIGFKIAQ
jgi:DNA-binding response OmpR family regulator